MTLPRWTLLPLLVLAALLLDAVPGEAQYFGRNKVQYRTFDFRILQTEHFDVYYYPEEAEAARDAARMAERWYHRLSRVLDHEFEQRQPLVLYGSHPEFQQTNTTSGTLSESTGGFTEVFKQRVVMPFTYSYEETDHIVGHELVHAFQYDVSGMGRAGAGLEAAARRFQAPGWFIEGMAEYLSVGPVDPLTAMWVRDAAMRGNMPSIARMTRDPRVFPYRWGQALWAYVGGRWGDASIGQILKLVGQGVPYPVAFQRILNVSLDQLSEEWHAEIRRSYLPLLAGRPSAERVARPLITDEKQGGRMNVAPVLSPDGRWVAFISELGFLDAELHLADAQTGRVVRTLQKGSLLDSHFGSLRYLYSAGAWSPDSRRFAFSALRGGADVLVVVDVQSGRRLQQIPVPGVGEISNPTWSPDGRTVVFSGIRGGITDLYAVDLETREARQLTHDRYTELHPAFSPDGGRLAFVTERGPGTDLDRLVYGPYRLALMDVASGAITPVPGMAGGKNINPVWTRDGRGLFFISNRDGIANIYRVELDGGQVFQVTDLFGGVSGITDISPALSGGREHDRLVFTSFDGNFQFDIFALDDAASLRGTPVPVLADERAGDGGVDLGPAGPALLPPAPRAGELAFNRVSGYLADPDAGLPSVDEARAYATVGYRPDLGLDYLGQPQVGVSFGGPFGGGVQGGVAGIFSDVLGRHTLFGAVQAQGQLDEIGFVLQYINTRERWNYGAAAQRMPYIMGFYNFGVDTVATGQGDLVVPTREIWRVRYFDSRLEGAAQYPFSPVTRVEFGAGVRRIATDYQIYKLLLDPATGAAFDQGVDEVDGIGFNMAQASIALVRDDALFGVTSPFVGERFRFELAPTVGQLQYVSALADYRRYLLVRPFTLALRGLHQGRYGRDADGFVDGRQIFSDLYLGHPYLIRGYYDVWSDCRTRDQDCAVLAQLRGSRLAVANAELRFPLVRQLTIGESFGFPPIEGITFFDAGLAWDSGSELFWQRFDPATHDASLAERRLLTSAGVGARMNLFGHLILEIDYVRPFDREQRWHWQFGMFPGF